MRPNDSDKQNKINKSSDEHHNSMDKQKNNVGINNVNTP